MWTKQRKCYIRGPRKNKKMRTVSLRGQKQTRKGKTAVKTSGEKSGGWGEKQEAKTGEHPLSYGRADSAAMAKEISCETEII